MLSYHFASSLVVALSLVSVLAAPLRAQAATSDSAEFVTWRAEQQGDVDGLRQKFMALARAIPADTRSWRPMEGTRSFRDVFAHIAAEGNTMPVGFGRPLPPGSVADFNAEEARLRALPDAQLIEAMDRAMAHLSAAMVGMSRSEINTPIMYFGRSTLPRVAATRILVDMHEHLGQLVAYARVNQIVPPWSRKS